MPGADYRRTASKRLREYHTEGLPNRWQHRHRRGAVQPGKVLDGANTQKFDIREPFTGDDSQERILYFFGHCARVLQPRSRDSSLYDRKRLREHARALSSFREGAYAENVWIPQIANLRERKPLQITGDRYQKRIMAEPLEQVFARGATKRDDRLGIAKG